MPSLSLQESLYHSTPIVGIPLGNDQKPNMMRAERRGYAVMLDWPSLNTEDLVAAIKKAATDPDMRREMVRAHELFVDQPESPQARAVWWVEYVMRNQGAQFLKPSSLSLPWYQYHLLDVLLLIGSVLLVINIALLVCCWKSCKCIFGRKISKDKTD